MKLSEAEKQNKRQRDNLQHICNRLMSGINFGSVKTWRDVYVLSGIDATTIASTYANSNAPVTFPELKKYCDELKAKLEESIKKRAEGITTDLIIDAKAGAVETVKEPVIEEPVKQDDSDYGLVPSPNEKAYLYWFQKKACAELLRGFGIS